MWKPPAPTCLLWKRARSSRPRTSTSLLTQQEPNICLPMDNETSVPTPAELNGSIHSTITLTTMYSDYKLYILRQRTMCSTTPSRPRLGRVELSISRDTLPLPVQRCVPQSRTLYHRVPISSVPRAHQLKRMITVRTKTNGILTRWTLYSLTETLRTSPMNPELLDNLAQEPTSPNASESSTKGPPYGAWLMNTSDKLSGTTSRSPPTNDLNINLETSRLLSLFSTEHLAPESPAPPLTSTEYSLFPPQTEHNGWMVTTPNDTTPSSLMTSTPLSPLQFSLDF